MEEILAAMEERTDEDGKIEAAALREWLCARQESFEAELNAEKAARIAEKQRFSLLEALLRADAKEIDYLVFRLLPRATFDDAGNLCDGEALLEAAKTEYGEFFGKRGAQLDGVRPGEGESGAELAREQFEGLSYQERAKLFGNDPELYHSLRG